MDKSGYFYSQMLTPHFTLLMRLLFLSNRILTVFTYECVCVFIYLFIYVFIYYHFVFFFLFICLSVSFSIFSLPSKWITLYFIILKVRTERFPWLLPFRFDIYSRNLKLKIIFTNSTTYALIENVGRPLKKEKKNTSSNTSIPLYLKWLFSPFFSIFLFLLSSLFTFFLLSLFFLLTKIFLSFYFFFFLLRNLSFTFPFFFPFCLLIFSHMVYLFLFLLRTFFFLV